MSAKQVSLKSPATIVVVVVLLAAVVVLNLRTFGSGSGRRDTSMNPSEGSPTIWSSSTSRGSRGNIGRVTTTSISMCIRH